MKMKKLSRLALALVATSSVILAGCGGGDSGGLISTNNPGTGGGGGGGGTPPGVSTVAVSGIVADGLLQNAKVCLDVNNNRICDTNEPSAMTNASGAYTINSAAGTNFPVLAMITAGVTIDSDYGAVGESYMLMAPAGKPEFVSPYTTLVQSEIDSGRSQNLREAESTVLAGMVGTAGQVGGLSLYSNYTDASAGALTTAQLKMYGTAQLLAKSFAATQTLVGANSGLQLSAALGQAAGSSMKHLLTQVSGTLTMANRDTLFASVKDSLVPTTATLASIAKAKAKTAAEPIEGAWIRTTGNQKEVFLFAGDGTFVHQTVATAITSTTTFDNGFGARYGRYTFEGGVLKTSLIEASGQSGPDNGSISGVTISGNTLSGGGLNLTRLTSATNPLVGGWITPNGSDKPQFLLFLDDTTYVHSTFYGEDDFQTGSASFFETARSAGMQRGAYSQTTTVSNITQISFSTIATAQIATTGSPVSIDFNGNLSIPGDPGVAVLQSDGAVSMEGARFVKLGTALGAKAISGLSETTRSRLWSGRYFSRSLGGSPALNQYIYVRGPSDVITFNQMPSGSDVTVACTPVTGPFTSVDPADGVLKQFVIGTGTAASAGYAQRRLNVGTPGSFLVYTPITRPPNATARCALPL
jgi:hypothetical protein